MLHIVICDDEPLFRELIQDYLRRYKAEKRLNIQVLEAESGVQLLNIIEDTTDILFLDIRMKGLDGIHTAKKLRCINEQLQIVFMTSAPEYALQGYKVNAFDYLVKPISYEMFYSMMEKCLSAIDYRSEYLLIKNYDSVRKVLLKTISYIETWERNLLVHTNQGNYTLHDKMKNLESSLSEKGFFRCNSGYLVNLAFVERLDGEQSVLCLEDGENIPISRPRKKECIAVLSEYWGENL